MFVITFYFKAVKNILAVLPFLSADDYRKVCIRLAGLCYHELTKDRGRILKVPFPPYFYVDFLCI